MERENKIKSTVNDLDKHVFNILYDIILPEPSMSFFVSCDLRSLSLNPNPSSKNRK